MSRRMDSVTNLAILTTCKGYLFLQLFPKTVIDCLIKFPGSTTTNIISINSWEPLLRMGCPLKVTMPGLCWITLSGAWGTLRSSGSTELIWMTRRGQGQPRNPPSFTADWSKKMDLLRIRIFVKTSRTRLFKLINSSFYTPTINVFVVHKT